MEAASSGKATRRAGLRAAAAEGAGPGCPAPSGRRSSPARGGQRRQRGPAQRPAAPDALPGCLVHWLACPQAYREARPASNAAADTDEQHSAGAAPPPLCDTVYQSLASAHVALQSARGRAGAGAGPGRPTPAVAREPGPPLRSVVGVG